MSERPHRVALGIIGDEVLKGEVEDRNTSYFIRQFKNIGVEVFYVAVIPDSIDVISEYIRYVRDKVDFVILTGGIGPTPDDVTRDAVAHALGKKLIIHPGAEKILEQYYGERMNEARRKMAMLPEGAGLILNPVSGAPGFIVENVIVFPGIPSLIEEMFPQVRSLFRATEVRKRVVYVESGESTFSDIMGDLMRDYPDLSIGSYPSFEKGYRVRFVVRGTNRERVEGCVGDFIERCEERGIIVKGKGYENFD